MNRRRLVKVLPFGLTLALAGSLSGGSALADLPPTPPPMEPRPASTQGTTSKTPKTAATPKTSPSTAPTAVPSDVEPALDDLPELTEREKQMLAIPWQRGPVKGSLGDIAEIDVPEGFLFVDGEGTRKVLELYENLVSGKELGLLASSDFSWFVEFQFSDIGYVKDEEKSDLDAEALLTSLREGNEAANQQKKSRGWRTLSLTGWATPPKYDETSQNLEWAPNVQDDLDKSVTVNHFIRILGREGVMEVSLMTSPEDYAKTLPATKQLLASFTFKPGKKYSEYRQGDKIAAIGLTGLIVGGGVAAAAKSGLLGGIGKFLAKGAKAIVLIGAAAAAGIAKLLGRKKDDA